MYIKYGIFLPPSCRQSKNPVDGTIHRFVLIDPRNEGFSNMLSALALYVFARISLASFSVLVQKGINPHLKMCISGSYVITG